MLYNKHYYLLFFILAFAPISYALQENQIEKNRQTVVEFYKTAFNKKNLDEAYKYLGTSFTTNNSSHVANGPAGLKKFIAYIKNHYPKSHVEIKKTFVEGNYVVLLVNFVMEPNPHRFAVVDIFRLDKNKIVEHWGLTQEFPRQNLKI